MAIAATFVKAGHQSCLTQNEASSIIQGFTDLITKTQANFNHTLATQLLASDFHTNSDGVDYLREEPVSQHLNRDEIPCSERRQGLVVCSGRRPTQ